MALLEQQAQARVPELVPIRYGRMLVSPFTFFRGAASIMAADLAGTPRSGVTVQLCGDAHLSNFGLFGDPRAADAVRHQRLRRDGEPSGKVLDDIKAALRDVAKADVALDVKIDPSLIGGLIVKMGSRMVDASVRTKLNSIRLAMKEVR